MPRVFRVLIIDDNPQDRLLVARELRKSYPEAELLEAVDQQQLDSHLKAVEFDVVLTDYHLKWTDGIRVLQAVKQRIPNCPVIMFTGTGDEEVAVEAMKQGLDDYIIKSVKSRIRLRLAVQSAVEHARTRARAAQLTSRLELLLSQLQVGVFTCSPEGRFLELNETMVDLLGCESAADAYQTTLASLFVHDDQAREFLRQVTESGKLHESETEIVATDSAVKSFRVKAKFVHTDGEQPRIDGLVEDASQRRHSELMDRQIAVAVETISMLSRREKDVLEQVVVGNANKVIARRLDISEKTVEKHRASLMKKLRVRSVAELVRLAILAESSTN
jgi:FixJ family two-component response regulator